MNNFGGNWTKTKIEILVDYAKAYLTIMNKHHYYKLLYFDGFAGSGFIIKDTKTDVDVTVGAARRIIEINEPRPFDKYYFVEKDLKNFKLLEKNTKDQFPDKVIHTVFDDCNKKLLDMASFLKEPNNKNYRILAYIDPCGMQVEWNSISVLKGLPIDMWVLVPTGMGVNRLVKTNGDISEAWLERLELFLGLDKEKIKKYFYKDVETLFPELTFKVKEQNASKRSAELYKKRLNEVFDYVSKPYELRNSTGSIMYHLFFTSNNKSGIRIANDIVKKYTN